VAVRRVIALRAMIVAEKIVAKKKMAFRLNPPERHLVLTSPPYTPALAALASGGVRNASLTRPKYNR
jgi:hypothetical protein